MAKENKFKPGKDIVKVQISLFSSDGDSRVLVYNKDRSHHYEGEVDQFILEAMDEEPKKYFYCRYKKNGFIELLGEAPPQDW